MNIDQIMRRVTDPALQTVAVKAVEVAKGFADKVATIGADKALTTVGKSAAIQAALPEAIRALSREGRPLQAAKAKAKAARDSIRVPALAKDDIVGHMIDREYRELFRGMDRADRTRLLLETKDAGLLAAALRVAPELSGIDQGDEQFAKHVEDRYFQMTAGDRLAEIEATESELAEAEAFYLTARVQLQNAAQMDSRNFDRLAGPIEKQVNAPWIKRDGTGRVLCVEVDANGHASYRDATSEEIADGVEYADYAAYQATRAPA